MAGRAATEFGIYRYIRSPVGFVPKFVTSTSEAACTVPVGKAANRRAAISTTARYALDLMSTSK
jgi:hypothetical protein